ncbi:molybdate ABC transporter substrate-binding protein [Paracoccus sp. 1_MG-2023]|uniref:molybdate ABC transporter substrate-binding protein n=1 Tax=unclassified Paracoccus (in: a-proteobacteria) TaxID=2688777 RepID=UPI001C0A2520|nr:MULTISPECIES: molybdate ABC transporter substrate-binding protein [unclassified Paracoccus (in: a-proteobacteria)]MBU2956265.1 molybdate ABC transporter substrate-binding protein [Paracoccus sp. C2R09]MDO6667941.1 molybdate ABC transporter substrate-binding protein [Paracoccus sp. 1_MG-2023]
MFRTLLITVMLATIPLRAGAETVVFAAASLTDALDRIAAEWADAGNEPVTISYAGSSALARQIQQGAPADLFISANEEWMDALVASGDVRANSRRDIASNALVLIGPGDRAPVAIDDTLDLPALLDGGRLSMAMISGVPAGIYGRQALQSLGLWDDVAGQVAQSDNVRSAMAFVARGEAPLGIVYATDAQVQPDVSVLGRFPDGSHAPIRYPAAMVTGGQDDGFLDFLTSDAARRVWRDFGFGDP